MRAALLLLAAVSPVCFAWSGLRSEYAGNQALTEAQGLLKGGPYTVHPGPGGGARAVGGAFITGPGGRTVPADLAVNFTRRATLNVAARALSAAVPVLGAGVLIYDVYDALRVKPDGQGGLDWDPGASQVPKTQYCATSSNFMSGVGYHVQGTFCGGSPAAAGAAICANANLQKPSLACTVVGTGPSSAQIRTDLGGYFSYGTINFTTSQALGCNPLLNGNAAELGPDGLCESDYPRQPIEAPFAAEKVLNATDYANSLDYENLLRDSIGLGPVTIPPAPEAVQEVPASGVPSIAGPVTTTQHANGTTETATGWNFARDPLRKNTGKWNPTTTTTEKDVNGNPVGTPTTTTTTTPDGEGTTDPNDPCTSDPSRLGCIGAGEVEDMDLPGEERPFQVSTQSGWGASDGACPAPPVVVVFGRSLTFDNAILCTFLAGIRFALLAVAGLVAARIVLGGFKEG